MHTDKSGTVSDSEWRRGVEQAASQLPRDEATSRFRRDLRKLFDQLDVNHDGQINRSEWDTGKFEITSD